MREILQSTESPPLGYLSFFPFFLHCFCLSDFLTSLAYQSLLLEQLLHRLAYQIHTLEKRAMRLTPSYLRNFALICYTTGSQICSLIGRTDDLITFFVIPSLLAVDC